MNRENENFYTCDLYLASYLKASGIELLGVDGPEKKARFKFENRKEIEKLAKGFYENALIPVTDFCHSLRDFKSLIFNYRG